MDGTLRFPVRIEYPRCKSLGLIEAMDGGRICPEECEVSEV